VQETLKCAHEGCHHIWISASNSAVLREILKHQLTAEFTIYDDSRADFVVFLLLKMRSRRLPPHLDLSRQFGGANIAREILKSQLTAEFTI